MFRQEAISGLTFNQVRFFLRPDADSPFYEVFTDQDTEGVTFFASKASRTGEQVLPCFSAWKREGLRSILIEHASRQGLSAGAGGSRLAEEILACLQGREGR